MEKFHYPIYIIIIVFLCACEKEDSNLIEGKWQLNTIISKSANGNHEYSCDSIYFNFQSGVFFYQRYISSNSIYQKYYYYDIVKDSISFKILEKDLSYADKRYLLWTDTIKTFHINQLNGVHLTLESDQFIYKLHDF